MRSVVLATGGADLDASWAGGLFYICLTLTLTVSLTMNLNLTMTLYIISTDYLCSISLHFTCLMSTHPHFTGGLLQTIHQPYIVEIGLQR